MEERCRDCPEVCKRLDATDDPVHYYLTDASPRDAITLVDALFQKRVGDKLKLFACNKHAADDQIAVLLEPLPDFPWRVDQDRFSRCICIMAEAVRQNSGTDLWFRFGPARQCCEIKGLASEVTDTIREIVACLSYYDSLLHPSGLSVRYRRPVKRAELAAAIASVAYSRMRFA